MRPASAAHMKHGRVFDVLYNPLILVDLFWSSCLHSLLRMVVFWFWVSHISWDNLPHGRLQKCFAPTDSMKGYGRARVRLAIGV